MLDSSWPRRDPARLVLLLALSNRKVPFLAASCWNFPAILLARDSLKNRIKLETPSIFSSREILQILHFGIWNDSPRGSSEVSRPPEVPSSKVTDRHGANSTANNTRQPFVTNNCTGRMLLTRTQSCNHVPLSTHSRQHPLAKISSNETLSRTPSRLKKKPHTLPRLERREKEDLKKRRCFWENQDLSSSPNHVEWRLDRVERHRSRVKKKKGGGGKGKRREEKKRERITAIVIHEPRSNVCLETFKLDR